MIRNFFNNLADAFARATERTPDGAPSSLEFRKFLTAVEKGNEQGVRDYLQKYPHEIDKTGPRDWTALYVAVTYQQHKIMETLLQNGACVDKKSGSGDTPLFMALLKEDRAATLILLDHGADPEEPCGLAPPMTPFDYAHVLKELNGQPEFLELLEQQPARREQALLEKERRQAEEQEKFRRKTEETLTQGVVPDASLRIKIKLKKE